MEVTKAWLTLWSACKNKLSMAGYPDKILTTVSDTYRFYVLSFRLALHYNGLEIRI